MSQMCEQVENELSLKQSLLVLTHGSVTRRMNFQSSYRSGNNIVCTRRSDDGHTTLVFPGPDATVEHPGASEPSG